MIAPLDDPEVMAERVVALIRKANDRQDITDLVQEATATANTTGYVLLGLAHVASRRAARMARYLGATAVLDFQHQGNGKTRTDMADDHPVALAADLLTASANDDLAAVEVIARATIEAGRTKAQRTVAVLAHLAADTLRADTADRLRAEKAKEN